MSRFSFKNQILELAVSISIQLRRKLSLLLRVLHILQNQLSLQDTGLLGIRTDVIELVPLIQVFFHQLPVKENNRNILLLRHINDFRRRSAIHQIYTKHIAGILQHFFHLLILHSLTSRRIVLEYIYFVPLCPFLGNFLVKSAHIAG